LPLLPLWGKVGKGVAFVLGKPIPKSVEEIEALFS
jgi:hypothetical protein